MDLAKIKIVGGERVPVSDADIDQAAKTLGFRFPQGYREYVTALGEGTLSDFIRVYPPWRIIAELEVWRERIRQYWFWDAGADVLTDEKAEESVIIADTLNGDELIFHPSEPERLFVLPRDEELIFAAGTGLMEAVAWLCGSGKLTKRFKPRDLEPFDSRTFERKQVPTTKRKTRRRAVIADLKGQPPDNVLQQFFLALEAWEEDALRAMKNPQSVNKYREILTAVVEKLQEMAEPFVSETFDIGNPSGYGNPTHYGKLGPRIVDVMVAKDAAEITTHGNNMHPLEKQPSNTPVRLFRLICNRDYWRVDGLWEITRSGRRKRVKMFL